MSDTTHGTIKVKLLSPTARMPERQHHDDSMSGSADVGYDLFIAAISHAHDHVWKLDFGLALQPPLGYYCELVPRSSIHKYNLVMANSVGIIDPGYRGSVCMMVVDTENSPLADFGDGEGIRRPYPFPKVGERFGQLVLRKMHSADLVQVAQLDESARGDGGFGSTGK